MNINVTSTRFLKKIKKRFIYLVHMVRVQLLYSKPIQIHCVKIICYVHHLCCLLYVRVEYIRKILKEEHTTGLTSIGDVHGHKILISITKSITKSISIMIFTEPRFMHWILVSSLASFSLCFLQAFFILQ